MAFAMLHFPMDKDQIQFWQEHPDEADVVGENFFDQYVTFDTSATHGDFNDDVFLDLKGEDDEIPSPSALLQSFNTNIPTKSSSRQNEQVLQALQEAPSLSGNGDYSSASFAPVREQQSRSQPVLVGPSDPIIGGSSSVSDSELLQLEGISLSSPKHRVAVPPSPPLIQQPSSSNPKKRLGNRFVDSVYATIRKVGHHNRGRQPNRAGRSSSRAHATMMESPRRGPRPGIPDFQPPTLNSTGDRDIDVKMEPVDSHGIPMSPPLTGTIPPAQEHHPPGAMTFINGNLDDPFGSEAMLAHSAAINTPLQTPNYNTDVAIDPNTTMRQPAKLRNKSSAEWPREGVINNNPPPQTFWTTGSYVPAGGTAMVSPWDDGSGFNPNPGNSMSSPRVPPANFAMHNPQQPELPPHPQYRYNNDLSGLMIHMPQPRQPQAAVLQTNDPEQLLTPRRSYRQLTSHQRGYHTEHRRPQPRAPSSGARHHGSMTSPRKQPTLQHASSSRCLGVAGPNRGDSVSPTPSRRRSSSMSVRKQRSFTRRATRTPSQGSLGSSSGGAGGGGGGIDFVNFTPNDKNVLMTGVAPSGSSKTKARREKEAMERRRKLSEAAVKAVKAAGGDIDKLVEEGFEF